VLPFIEQNNVQTGYVRYSPSAPTVTWQSPVNASAVATRIPVVECPSSFVLKTTPIWADAPTNSVAGEYARTDYFAVSGANGTAYQSAWGVAPGDASGIFGNQINAAGGLVPGETFAYALDGTSNTIALAEDSGRPWIFVANGKQLTSTSDPLYAKTPTGLFPPTAVTDRQGALCWQTSTHGAWAHNNTYNVYTFNGLGNILGGPCAVNCSNMRGLYAFHPGGAHAGIADGSVRFMSSTTSAMVVMAMCTRRNGEVFNDQ
jgi:hypothetical protein